MPRKHLFGTGLAFRIKGMQFDPAGDYRACMICGAIYQPAVVLLNTKRARDNWARKHARTHTMKEHKMLRLSGLSMTPEAANKLAAFGLIPLDGDEEVRVALFESSPMPVNDAES